MPEPLSTPHPGTAERVCRSCSAGGLELVLDLGLQPLSNAYLDPAEDVGLESRYPLVVRICPRCRLLQADAVVAREAIFSDYAYFSSYSDTWLEHARTFAQEMTARMDLGPRSRVVEVASNDGYLLRHFAALGVPSIGVEPAANVAAVAVANGVDTVNAFLGRATAEELVSRGGPADLVVANNVLAHVPDLDDFIGGLRILLGETGVLSVEVAHVGALLAGAQFDTIYHEHYAYYSILSCRRALERHGLYVTEARMLPTHGGSFRILATPEAGGRVTATVAHLERAEQEAGVDDVATYSAFAGAARQRMRSFTTFLKGASARGELVVGYGAAAKGNTLLNSCGVTEATMRYAVDRSPHKQGRLLPGSHLPILAPEVLKRDRPRYVVALAWNLVDELQRQLAHIGTWGGELVTTMPSTTVVR